jgi:Ran GTPase-activating protein (RanGAP) involved in mRNA processing and transport
MSLNVRNSKFTKHSTEYLAKMLNNSETILTGLCLKYCFLNFE